MPSAKPITIDPDYTNRKGYDPAFLGFKIPMPKPGKILINLVGATRASIFPVLRYHHYTVVFRKDRRMALFTAVNMDGKAAAALDDQMPSRSEIGADKWFTDPRLAKAAQIPTKWYAHNDFDLGHIVRRQDACWGDTLETALAANNDTFHLTNASPQHKDFNRNAERWKGLEDYILRSTNHEKMRAVVFSGAILLPTDRLYDTLQIPAFFWKVVVALKEDGSPSATAYLVNQDDLIANLPESRFVFGPFKSYQTSIVNIESRTGLSFGLNQYDPFAAGDGKRAAHGIRQEAKLVESYGDLIL